MRRVELGEEQIQAIELLRTGSILCGGVGSGKSRTALAYFLETVCGSERVGSEFGLAERPRPLFIITTARKRDSLEWEDEMFLFGLGRPGLCAHSCGVIVDSWNNLRKYEDQQDAFFIFDEQRLVGYGAWTKSAIKIARNNQWILLSATPGDVWLDYMPVFVMNGFYRNKTDFVTQHVVYRSHRGYNQVDRYVGKKILERLRKKILVDIPVEKRTKRHFEQAVCEYPREAYRSLYKTRRDPETGEPFSNASALFYALRKALNSDPSRFERVLRIIQRHPRAIIFYNFDYELDLLKQGLNLAGVEFAQWNGHLHEPLPEGERWVYLVQYAAGAEGWNCVTTDTVIFYSQTYSYKQFEQACGRIDRRNTPYTDLYYYTIRSSAPVDLAIRRALQEKRNFSEKAFLKGTK